MSAFTFPSPDALVVGALSEAKMLTCLSLGMLNGRGGADREFPFRLVWFRLIWACILSPAVGFGRAQRGQNCVARLLHALVWARSMSGGGGGGGGDLFLTILFSVGLVSVRAILRISAA